MRSKGRPRAARQPADHADPIGIDLGASARQIGLMETSSGGQYGLGAIVIALLAAILLRPIGRALRAWFRQ